MTKNLKSTVGGALLTSVVWLLAACAASRPHVDDPRPVYIDRPVYSPCIARADADKIEADRPRRIGGRLTGDAVHDALLLGAKSVRQEAWADKVMVVINGCSG